MSRNRFALGPPTNDRVSTAASQTLVGQDVKGYISTGVEEGSVKQVPEHLVYASKQTPDLS